MPIVRVQQVGGVGVIKDLGAHVLAPNAWSDASNIRFLDGSAYQFLGHGEVYSSPSVAPQFVMPINVAGARYWLYASAAKTYAVNNTGGVTTHTDITHATPRTGIVNQWSGTVLGGIPILNVGDASKVPMYWDQNLANKFVDLTNWPAATYCKSLRSFKNTLIALNVTKAGVNYPHMVKWSHPADPGTLPTTWDITDATKDAGEFDLAEGQDPIVDGLGLKESFIVYKESSTHRIDYIGGAFVFGQKKVFGMSGLLNRGCAVEFDGWHFAVTGTDVVIHDGYTAQSVLDKKSRRFLFQNIDTSYADRVFVFKNPFLNEIFVCYPSIGATSCDKAMVYNFTDKTISFRSLPNVNHAAFGPVDNSLNGAWNQDSDPWSADLTLWNGPDYTPNTARVLMASADVKLYMLDASASFNGVIPVAYLERRGIGMGDDEHRKMIRSVRPRIAGNNGETVIIKIGGHDADPYADPAYPVSMTHVIGTTISNDGIVEYRYPAIRFETGTAYQWRLDNYDMDITQAGEW